MRLLDILLGLTLGVGLVLGWDDYQRKHGASPDVVHDTVQVYHYPIVHDTWLEPMPPNTVVLGWANDSSTAWVPFIHRSDNPAELSLTCGWWMEMPPAPLVHKPVE